MSAYYEAMRAKAASLIKDKGRAITIKRYGKANTAADLLNGTVTRPLLQTIILRGATLPASAGTLEAFDVRFMEDVSAGTDVRFAIVAAQDDTGVPAAFLPGPGDEAEIAGETGTWLLMGNTPLNVDGTPVIFSIGFRRP